MSDIIKVTEEVLEIFKKHDLNNVQSMLAIKSIELQVYEGIIRDVVADTKKGHDNVPGIG